MALLGVLISSVIVLVTAIYLFFKVKHSYWKNRGIPYAKPRIPYGNFEGFHNRVHITHLVAELYKELKGQGPFAGIYFFQQPIVLATDIEMIKNVLIKDFNFFTNRGIYFNERDDPLTGNLFMIDGSQWKYLRTKLTPTFTSGKMKFMLPTIVDVGEQFQATLKDMIRDSTEIELREILARFTTDVIGSCAFGIDCNSLKDPNAQFRVMGKKVFDTPRNGIFMRNFISRNKSLARSLRIKHFHDDVSEFFLKVVQETITLRKEKNIRRNDFMDLLIQLMDTGKLADDADSAVGKLSFEQVAAQAFVFFLAGFETSSTAMSFTLYELALNQDIQDKARRSINETLKKYDGKLTYECISDITFIDQIINESLRKYPPGGMLVRLANEDYKVPGTDHKINKGTAVFIPVYGIHHDPEFYPNPEIYDPERFAPGAERNQNAFLPFGEGPRNCIGLRFGMMQARVGLVTLLRNFKFSPCSRTTIPMEFSTRKTVLSPKEGLWLQVEVI